MLNIVEKLEELQKDLKKYLQDAFVKNGEKKFLLGLSGGIDSTTLAYVIVDTFGSDAIETFTITGGRIQKEYTEHANDIASGLKIKDHHIIHMEDLFGLSHVDDPQDFVNALGLAITFVNNQHKNTRTTVISGNLVEKALLMHFFGSFQGEFAPFGNMTKSVIRQLAKKVRVPEEVYRRIPGAGIEGAPTDEEMMGVSFRKAESFLANVNIREPSDTGGSSYEVRYMSERNTVQTMLNLQDEQLAHLERLALDSTRIWISEGPKPKIKPDRDFSIEIGEGLFRPSSYDISLGEDVRAVEVVGRRPSHEEEIPGIVTLIPGDTLRYIDKCGEVIQISAKKRSYRGGGA